MRVIAGSHKGRLLLTSSGSRMRPTSGRVKEALFSILSNRVPGAIVLDLYAGTGAIGIEAISRGASQVVFVESHRASLRILKQNLRRCGMEAQAEVYEADVVSFLRSKLPTRVSLVFADPPYAEDPAQTVLPSLNRSAMIGDQTLVILEHRSNQDIPATVGRLIRTRHYKYGDTSLSLFEVGPEERSG